jgi:hypothetical protein
MTRVQTQLRLRKLGVVNPVWTYRAAEVEKLELAVLVAVIFMESAGGDNVFGHDPTVAVGWGAVTQPKYEAYLHLRQVTGECQGVGPCQLTSKGLQDEADAAGGCWRPEHNLAIGARFVAGLLADHSGDLLAALTAYNGSGTLAERYGARAVALVDHYRAALA